MAAPGVSRSFVFFAFTGVVLAIVVGLLLPQFILNAGEGSGAASALNFAAQDVSRRLQMVFQGNFSDVAAWGVPLFGLICGLFWAFISEND